MADLPHRRRKPPGLIQMAQILVDRRTHRLILTRVTRVVRSRGLEATGGLWEIYSCGRRPPLELGVRAHRICRTEWVRWLRASGGDGDKRFASGSGLCDVSLVLAGDLLIVLGTGVTGGSCSGPDAGAGCGDGGHGS